jgi:hypothetical protein
MLLPSNFIVGLPSTTVAGTSESPFFWMKNPTSSGVQIQNSYVKLSSLTAAVSAILKLYLNPTISTNGTPYTPVNLGAAFSVSSAVQAYTIPTASSNGTYFGGISSVNFQVAIFPLSFILLPGNSFLATITLSTGSSNVLYENSWQELTYF